MSRDSKLEAYDNRNRPNSCVADSDWMRTRAVNSREPLPSASKCTRVCNSSKTYASLGNEACAGGEALAWERTAGGHNRNQSEQNGTARNFTRIPVPCPHYHRQ